MKIFVGNLAFTTTEEQLRHAFEDFGRVESVSIVRDQCNERSRGFAFIEMPEHSEAETAIKSLNGKALEGRELNVSGAGTKTERTKNPAAPGRHRPPKHPRKNTR
jgi:RNA recognition motif-containing protein